MSSIEGLGLGFRVKVLGGGVGLELLECFMV